MLRNLFLRQAEDFGSQTIKSRLRKVNGECRPKSNILPIRGAFDRSARGEVEKMPTYQLYKKCVAETNQNRVCNAYKVRSGVINRNVNSPVPAQVQHFGRFNTRIAQIGKKLIIDPTRQNGHVRSRISYRFLKFGTDGNKIRAVFIKSANKKITKIGILKWLYDGVGWYLHNKTIQFLVDLSLIYARLRRDASALNRPFPRNRHPAKRRTKTADLQHARLASRNGVNLNARTTETGKERSESNARSTNPNPLWLSP